MKLFVNFIEAGEKFFQEEGFHLNFGKYNLLENALKIFYCVSSSVRISSDYDNYVNYAVFHAYLNEISNYADRVTFSHWWRRHWANETNYPNDKEVGKFKVFGIVCINRLNW